MTPNEVNGVAPCKGREREAVVTTAPSKINFKGYWTEQAHMQIKVEGSENFVSMIIPFHETLWPKVANRFPHLQKLEDKKLFIYETTSIHDVGLSRLDFWEILINHYFTKNNPKFLYEVYGHELAHFMASHGGTWIDYMKAMELPVRDVVPISPELEQWRYIAVIKCNCSTYEVHKSKVDPSMTCSRCGHKFRIV